MPFLAIGIIVALALGGGVAVEADKSLPGDALYGFKVGINENVRSALAIGAEAQANWDIEAVNRRLDEAEKLAAKGRLDASAQTKVEADFNASVRVASQSIAELRTKGDYEAAADASARLEKAIEVHARSLGSNASAEAQANVSLLLNSIQARLGEVSALKANVEAEAAMRGSSNSQAGAGFPSGNASATGTQSAQTNASATGSVNGSASSSNSGAGAGVTGGASGTINIGL